MPHCSLSGKQQTEMTATVSILVRSHNDRSFVEQTLAAIAAQKTSVKFEVLCCDDASTDGTPEIIAAAPGVRIVPRPDGPYFPGRTLNRMIQAAAGDIIVFNNADAIPLNGDWLENLTEPLRNGTADAVYANQLPRPDAQYLVRKDNERAFGDGSVAAHWKFFFSLASSAAFRDDLLKNPFNETFRYSEDVEWAHRRPIRIRYAANALVEHSHNYTLPELARRFYGEGFADARIYNSAPSLFRSLAGAFCETLRDVRYLIAHPAGRPELPGALRRRLIQKLQYRRGARDFLKGENHA